MEVSDLIRVGDKPSDEILANAAKLIAIVNEFEAALQIDFPGKKFHCNSGIRTPEHQIEIYQALRAQDVAAGKPPRNIPMGSQHLHGNAVDLSVPGVNMEDLQRWFLSEPQMEMSENLGVYYESFAATAPKNGYGGWIHLQIVAPASGDRFFNP